MNEIVNVEELSKEELTKTNGGFWGAVVFTIGFYLLVEHDDVAAGFKDARDNK
jgi:hypothetical protein